MANRDEIRRPEFIEKALGKGAITSAPFLGNAGAKAKTIPPEKTLMDPKQPTIPPAPLPPPPPVVAMAEVEQRLRAEFDLRVGAAIDLLRLHGERLAAEARVDVLELAFVIARKIIDTELSQSIEPLVAMIRTAVRRLGESRRIVVRLCSEDVEALEEDAKRRGSPALSGLSLAQIEVVADDKLERGDCMVEGDLGSADGRIDTRMEELRRAVLSSSLEDESE